MRILFGILFLLLFSACDNDKPKAVITGKSEIDSLPKQEEPRQVVKKGSPKHFNIDSFLQKPFDLYEFKKKKGANSGFQKERLFFFKPEYEGVYYRFFLFGGTGRCNFGERRISKVRGLVVTTYKPLGKYKNDYLDPDEELIYLKAICNNKELPRLAFVGFDTTHLKKKLGSYHFKRNNWLVYASKKKALLLKTKGRIISELRYIHMNKELQKAEDIDIIIEDKY